MAKKLQTSVAPSSSERDWQAEDDFRTLERADELRSDRRRLGGAMKHGKRRLKAMTRIMSGRR